MNNNLKIIFSYFHKVKWFFYHFKKPFVETWKYWIKYLIDPKSSLDYHIVKYGILNDFISTKAKNFIKDDWIVFDIWANVGLISLPLSKYHIPKWKVYSFEPDNENYSKLLINKELNKLDNIEVKKVALQNNYEIDELSFYVRRAIDWEWNNNQWLSSLWNPWLHTKEKISVKASTIDKIVKENSINKIDFIKIDVEWFEYEVLEWGKKSIKEFMPIIQYEFSPILDNLLKKENCLNCFNFLKSLNYTQYRIINEEYLEPFNNFDFDIDDCNILCFDSNNIPKEVDKFLK